MCGYVWRAITHASHIVHVWCVMAMCDVWLCVTCHHTYITHSLRVMCGYVWRATTHTSHIVYVWCVMDMRDVWLHAPHRVHVWCVMAMCDVWLCVTCHHTHITHSLCVATCEAPSHTHHTESMCDVWWPCVAMCNVACLLRKRALWKRRFSTKHYT